MPVALGISHLIKEAKHKPSNQDYSRLSAVLSHISHSSLSNREIECLALTLCGLSAKHIASFLKNSHRTVEKILSQAYQKLDVYNKQDMVEKMYQNFVLNVILEFGGSLFRQA